MICFLIIIQVSMKIGILTFHSSINNGAVMQCYSLVQRLCRDFPRAEVEIIDYRMPIIEKNYDVSLKNYVTGYSFIVKIKRLLIALTHPEWFKWQKERKEAFACVGDILPLSKQKIWDGNIEKLFSFINQNYDAVVVGSDAIWNYTTRGYPNPYFLSQKIHVPMFTYAASCYGMSFEKISKEQRDGICDILDCYVFLGVRDEASEQFVSFVGAKKKPVHTCDPTAFLDVEHLPVQEGELRVKLRKKGFDFEKNTILVMGSDSMVQMVQKLYGGRYQIAALYNYSRYADVNLYDLNPFEWAFVFRYAELTFTTFFHGTMLSLRNGVPVICIALETEYAKKHKPKVLDLLERVGLEEYYFHTDYKSLGVEEIHRAADRLLEQGQKKFLLQRMDQEAQTSSQFFEAIKNTLLKGENNDD